MKNCAIPNGSSTGRFKRRRHRGIFPRCSWPLHVSIGYGYLGRGGFAASLSLDAGIPLGSAGQMAASPRRSGACPATDDVDDQFVYTLGLKFGFLRGPKLGSRGVQFGAFGEIGKGSFQSGTTTEGGIYAGGGFSLRYSPGLQARPFTDSFYRHRCGRRRCASTRPNLNYFLPASVSAASSNTRIHPERGIGSPEKFGWKTISSC